MAADATGLHCPNCGAPAAAGAVSCAYCHAPLATISCPKCFALMFAQSVYCPHCGTRRVDPALGARTAPCPGCRGRMREITIGDAALLECGSCQGTWVDTATFDGICTRREAQAAVLSAYGAPVGERPSTTADFRYRPCVACGRMMNRVNFGKVSGTVVDVCKGHGAFLDAGELHAIVQFIADGGMERARQRQIDDLKDAEAQLRATEQARSLGFATAADSTPSSSWSLVDVQALLNHLTKG